MEKLKKKFLFLINSSTLLYSLLGLILVGFGVLSFKTNIFSTGDKVEVLETTKSGPESSQDLIVEISGSVEKPAVYKLPTNSRVDDLLIVSGGLSINADRDWVNKNVNRAAKLSDGQKIYIYSQSEVQSAKNSGGIKPDQVVLGADNGGLVNINTSDQKGLESLVGIGPVYAQNIIEHRPYSNLEELVSKGAISQKVFEKIKNDITN